MKKVFIVVGGVIILILIILYFMAPLTPLKTLDFPTRERENYAIITYTFDEINDVKISNGVIVRSKENAYLVRDEVHNYTIDDYEKILGAVGDYLVTYLDYYEVRVRSHHGVIWSRSLKSGSSVAIGKDFVVVTEHDDNNLKVNVVFYFPGSGREERYSFQSDRKGTFPKVVANGRYAVVGVPYTWELYYFEDGKLLWGGSLPLECGYEDYPEFSLVLTEEGYGYAISSEGHAFAYFTPSGSIHIGLNRGYCLSFVEEPPKNLTFVTGAAIFDKCVVLEMTYLGEYPGLYFCEIGCGHYPENFTFKADPAKKIISSNNYLLALYNDHASIFNCSEEVLHIQGTYEDAYPLGNDFLLVKYEGNKTHLYIPLSNISIELDGVKIVGTFEGRVVGTRDNELILVELKV
jgi:hypothetical protein